MRGDCLMAVGFFVLHPVVCGLRLYLSLYRLIMPSETTERVGRRDFVTDENIQYVWQFATNKTLRRLRASYHANVRERVLLCF